MERRPPETRQAPMRRSGGNSQRTLCESGIRRLGAFAARGTGARREAAGRVVDQAQHTGNLVNLADFTTSTRLNEQTDGSLAVV